MYEVITFKQDQILEVSRFDDEDEARAYYTELAMRQNYGEKQLQEVHFKLVFPANYF